MARHSKIENEVKRLRTLSPDTLSAYTVRLPPGIALEAANFAREHNYQMARGLLEIFTLYARAMQSGAILEFDGDFRRQLDLIASAFGTTRAAVVQRIVGENLVRYLQQAVALQAERGEIERLLQQMKLDAESPTQPVKPEPKTKK